MNLFKEEKTTDPFIYTEDQLMARLRFFIGICLALTLTGIVFVVLYSIIFATTKQILSWSSLASTGSLRNFLNKKKNDEKKTTKFVHSLYFYSI